ELTIPEQTATGKGTSNPLMAGSLPKNYKANLVGLLLKRCCCVVEKTKLLLKMDSDAEIYSVWDSHSALSCAAEIIQSETTAVSWPDVYTNADMAVVPT
ncbi:hypothetical protein Tco_1287163, partial [Tanacetum coccineum]